MNIQQRVFDTTLRMILKENEHFCATGHTKYGLLQSRFDPVTNLMTFFKECMECKQ